MVIFDTFIWLHIPKVAGTTIRDQIKYQGGTSVEGVFIHKGHEIPAAHMTAQEIIEVIPETELRKPTFAFCRNPMSRFRSACAYSKIEPKAMIRKLQMIESEYDFDARLALAQVSYAFDTTNWMKIEDAEGKIVEIDGVIIDLRIRSNVSPSDTIVLNRRQKRFVTEYYGMDYEKFGYH